MPILMRVRSFNGPYFKEGTKIEITKITGEYHNDMRGMLNPRGTLKGELEKPLQIGKPVFMSGNGHNALTGQVKKIYTYKNNSSVQFFRTKSNSLYAMTSLAVEEPVLEPA